MKNTWFIAALAALSIPHHAVALSTEQNTSQNSDGSPKFADPDDQGPGFIVTPGNTGNGTLSFGADTTTMPTMGDSDSDRGAQAFDQAFAHQQGKE